MTRMGGMLMRFWRGDIGSGGSSVSGKDMRGDCALIVSTASLLVSVAHHSLCSMFINHDKCNRGYIKSPQSPWARNRDSFVNPELPPRHSPTPLTHFHYRSLQGQSPIESVM